MLRSINTRTPRITPRWDSNSLNKYLQDVTRCCGEILTADEEVDLFKKVKEWDKSARERFIKANLRFVISVAKQYSWSWANIQDLISEWNIWLIKAVDRFDETKWFKFISYAVWRIRQSILQYITSNSTIRLPNSQIMYSRRINDFIRKFEQEEQREPTPDEIAEWLSLEDKDIESYQKSKGTTKVSRLDGRKEDDWPTMWEWIADVGSKPTDLDLEENMTRDYVRNAAKKELSWLLHGFDIIYSYYVKKQTLEEIGFNLEISRERVRQIKKRAEKRLRSKPEFILLHQSLDE